MGRIFEKLQENEEEYKLKTDEDLIEKISLFGNGETEFHTIDIERIIKEKQSLCSFIYKLGLNPEDII